ncbi:MAG: phenylalanine--tRNA ligase subunit beta [Gemmatimonadetes bacterium]|nr:phenylalanine--tRNA ligase subunit beta [Gemmatimonadota bacterium]
MNVSWEWLRAIAPDLEGSPDEIAQRLALRGAPVASVTVLSEGLDGVRVARVEATERHPNADRLTVCTVDAGDGARLRVVCGAPNVRAGGLYPLAPVGTTLPGGVVIQRAKIRGETSEGMLCSARELGIGHDQSGLLELPSELAVGTPIVDALGLRDARLDVEVTANRGDLLSHRGVARELVPGGEASLGLPMIPGGTKARIELASDPAQASVPGATVRIEAPDLCFRYLGAVVRGVKVGPSPAWLQARLRAVGSRPINNVVDATNYVLLELGQPLHAFDLGKLAEATIVVRRPRPGEKTLKTLDGADRVLGPDMLMVCDAARPVAVAGVMGGLESEVTAVTTDVLLECARFEPKSIRATRRSLGLSTDASYRFERGVDAEGLERALARALEIIVATACGSVEPRVADCHPRPFERSTVELRPARVERVLGVPFQPADLARLLAPLGFDVAGATQKDDGALRVGVPGYRAYDVTREIDLIEEVARTHGFDAFPAALAPYRSGTVPDHPLFQLEDRLRDLLVARGLFEAHTPAFVGAAHGEVRLKNPLSADEGYLRTGVLPSLLRRVEHNWSRGTRDVRLFELATAFARGHGEHPVHEEPRLAAVLTGRRTPVHFAEAPDSYLVWDLKGLLEEAARAAWADATVEPGAPDGRGLVTSEGFSVRVGGDMVGWGGRVAGGAVDSPPWADVVWGLELTLPAVPAGCAAPLFRSLPPFPGVERDLALVVADRVAADAVESAIRARGGELLRDVGLFDLYRGKGVPEGYRSLAYRLRFVSDERTLTDEEVDRSLGAVVAHLKEVMGVERRG